LTTPAARRLPLIALLGALLVAPARTGAAAGPAPAGPTDPADPLLTAAEAELDRLWTSLRARPEAPYFISYGLVDRVQVDIVATHGALAPVSTNRVRMGDVDLRVGSPALDNTHKLRDAGWGSEPERFWIDLPLTDEPYAVRHALWRATDDTYRSAVRRLLKVRGNDAVKVEREDQSDDYSSAPVEVDLGHVERLVFDPAPHAAALKAASARFLAHPAVHDSNVSLSVQDEIVWTLNTEGTRVRRQRWHLRLSVYARTIAEDGQEIAVYDSVEARAPEELPGPEELAALVDAVAEKLTALRKAPVVDPFSGPAILRGRAAGVFFHEVLGHRAEGHRQKDEDEGQTLTDMVGKRVFPSFISVYDDPTLTDWGGVPLNGSYRFDDEGVRAERVDIVKDGVVKGFLMSRAPIASQGRSNGHGRRQPGEAPVARQGNLVIEVKDAVPYAALREQLIAEVKRQGKPFGLIFDDITGGFTLTGRGIPNSYAVQPVTVWRVWPDGRPDELVRGVDLIGTPLVTFERIIAGSDEVDVFNGVCGAESGWVPVSAVSPDLLVKEVEVQRREKNNERPPLLPAPAAGGAR
jgi:predicted Zn-dependent protease